MEQHPATPSSTDQPIKVQVHTAPRFWPIVLTSAVIGALVGAIIGFFGEPSMDYTVGSAVGFFAMFCAGLGIGLGALAYVIIDRVTSRKTTQKLAVPLAGETDSKQQG